MTPPRMSFVRSFICLFDFLAQRLSHVSGLSTERKSGLVQVRYGEKGGDMLLSLMFAEGEGRSYSPVYILNLEIDHPCAAATFSWIFWMYRRCATFGCWLRWVSGIFLLLEPNRDASACSFKWKLAVRGATY